MRTNRKKSPDLVANDVRWHPYLENVVSTASTNGTVIVWDLTRLRTGGQDAVFRHGRTVNRLAWNNVNGSWLLSAGQDGVCRLWDARCQAGAVVFPPAISSLREQLQAVGMQPQNDGSHHLAFAPGVDALRDVQFDPFDPFAFASAGEDGSVQLWDVRRPDTTVSRFMAHAGLLMTLQFHPTQRGIIATGGRDRLVKVWALDGASSSWRDAVLGTANAGQESMNGGGARSESEGHLVTVQTTASVARLTWRETSHPWAPLTTAAEDHDGVPASSMSFQLTTAAALLDNTVYTWDVRHPSLPVALFGGHRDVATGLVWLDQGGTMQATDGSEAQQPPTDAIIAPITAANDHRTGTRWLLTAGKDGRVLLHDPLSAGRPQLTLRTSALAMSTGAIAFCHHDIDRASFWDTSPQQPQQKAEPEDVVVNASLPAVRDHPGSGVKPSKPQQGLQYQFEVTSVPTAASQHLAAGEHNALSADAVLDPPAATIARLAHEYRTEGAPVEILCAHNARVAAACGLQMMASTWSVLGVLFGPRPEVQPKQAAKESAKKRPQASPYYAALSDAADMGWSPADVHEQQNDLGGSSDAVNRPHVQQQAQAAPTPPAVEPAASQSSAPTLTATEPTLALTDLPVGNDADNGTIHMIDGKIQLHINDDTGMQWPWVGATAALQVLQQQLQPTQLQQHQQKKQPLLQQQVWDPSPVPIPGFVHGLLEALALLNPDAAGPDVFSWDLAGARAVPAAAEAKTAQRELSGGPSSAAVGAANAPTAVDKAGKRPLTVAAGHSTPIRKLLPQQSQNGFGFSPATAARLHAAEAKLIDAAFADDDDAVAGAASLHMRILDTNVNDFFTAGGVSLAAAEEEAWKATCLGIAGDILRWYAEQGDVQACVTISRVLGPSVELHVGKRVLQQWLVQYIDLLHRLQLWSPASTVMARASDEGIRRLNQLSTSVVSACGNCSKDTSQSLVPDVMPKQSDGPASALTNVDSSLPRPPAANEPAFCDDISAASASPLPVSASDIGTLQAVAPTRCRSCAHDLSTCAICLEPVRGLYTMCQGCGHGGHLDHMQEWFATSTLCPAGCMHVCALEMPSTRALPTAAGAAASAGLYPYWQTVAPVA